MAQYVLQQLPTNHEPVTADPQSVDFGFSSLDEAVHELRQPLSVIESLAYYLELTSEDEAACAHLQRIQAMVERADRILKRVSTLDLPLQPRGAWSA